MPVKKLFILLVICAIIGTAIPLVVTRLILPPKQVPAPVQPLPTAEREKPKSDEAPPPKTNEQKQADRVVTPPIARQPVDDTPDKPLYMTGFVERFERTYDRNGVEIRVSKGKRISLSDGRVISDQSSDVAVVDSTGVRFKDGTKIWSMPGKGRAAQPVQQSDDAGNASVTSPQKADTGKQKESAPPPPVAPPVGVVAPGESAAGPEPRRPYHFEPGKPLRFPVPQGGSKPYPITVAPSNIH